MASAPVRVLLVHKDYEPNRGGGGTARHIHGLASALAGLGCDVVVAAPNPEPISQPYRTEALTSFSWLQNRMKSADVVHIHGARSTTAVAGAAFARMAGKPFFYTPHCWYDPRSRLNAVFKWIWDQTAERFLLTACSKTIVLTEYWQEFLRRRLMPSRRTAVVPNCVLLEDLRRAQAQGADTSGPRLAGHPAILSVGRLSPEKRGSDVIEAIARSGLETAHFHVVGKGPDREAMEKLAADRGVADRVTFYGFIDDQTLTQMVGGSDVFVLASEEEGLPTVLLEMIIRRMPIISTSIPGCMAIMDPVGVHSHYPPGDVPALAALLARSEQETITEQMVATAIRTFTWEERAKDILSLYKAALAR